MSLKTSPIATPARVLSTLNQDGSRRRIRPRLSPGRYWRMRRAMAGVLMATFLILPHLRIGGGPAILLDLPRREFSLFGTTFLATETLLFMLFFVSCIIAIFAFTALFGRVWCGWACPQTVYMEFLFRPIEHWLERGRLGSLAMDGKRRPHPRRVAKQLIYLGLSLVLALTFLAYFVGAEQLAAWVRRPPAGHPTAFAVMLITTTMIFFDFGWFREQTCIVACPYGRLQSVLLDPRSLIVGYDPRRGEPRMKGRKSRPAEAGDCIDCGLCTITCPTGIDIREGLQMECIHCTQCMDACDPVMAKFGRPPGLIRYTSRDELDGRRPRLLRPRVVMYSLALATALLLLVFDLGTRADAEVTLLRGAGAPFFLAAGGVTNLVRIKVTNRGRAERAYRVELPDLPGARLIAPFNPFPVGPGRTREVSVFVILPRSEFTKGERRVRFRLTDGHGFSRAFTHDLIGPEAAETEAPGETEDGR